jgi:hypothetical protein
MSFLQVLMSKSTAVIFMESPQPASRIHD